MAFRLSLERANKEKAAVLRLIVGPRNGGMKYQASNVFNNAGCILSERKSERFRLVAKRKPVRMRKILARHHPPHTVQ